MAAADVTTKPDGEAEADHDTTTTVDLGSGPAAMRRRGTRELAEASGSGTTSGMGSSFRSGLCDNASFRSGAPILEPFVQALPLLHSCAPSAIQSQCDGPPPSAAAAAQGAASIQQERPVGWKFFLDGGNIVFVVGVDDNGNGERQGPEWCGESYSVDIDTCQLTVFPWPSNAESWHVVRRRGSENSAIRVDWSEGVAIFDRCTAVDPCWIPTPDYSCSLDHETP